MALAELQKSIAELAVTLEEDSYPYLQANFYPPYHGHNVCDAHFGQIKIATRKALADLEHPAPKSRETVIAAAAGRPRTRTARIPDARPKKRETAKVSEVGLRRGKEELVGKHKLALKKLICWLFDPCSSCPCLGYPYSPDACRIDPIRASISQTGVAISEKMAEQHRGDKPPWLPSYDVVAT